MKTVLFLLGELDDDDLDWMIATGDRLEVAAGTVLIHEGQPLNNLYILLEGVLSVTTIAMQGREIANLLSGDVVGEMSFVDTRPPSATVTAKRDSLILAISRDKLAERLRFDGGFAARFYRALAISLSTRLRMTVHQLTSFNIPPLADQELPAYELGQDAKASVALAENRLDWLLRRLQDAGE